MKSTKLILLAILLSCLNFSCSKKDEDLSSLQNQKLSYEAFFEKVASMNLEASSENIIYITYNLNSTNRTIEYLSFEEREPDFFVLDTRINADDFTVECQNGDDSWNDTCSGKISCGRLIAKCLDEGGCALTCQNEMAFAPRTKTFYLSL